MIRLSAPIWSSFPHRPQFDKSFFHCSYCAAVTGWRAGLVCATSTPAETATAATTHIGAIAKALISILPLADCTADAAGIVRVPAVGQLRRRREAPTRLAHRPGRKSMATNSGGRRPTTHAVGSTYQGGGATPTRADREGAEFFAAAFYRCKDATRCSRYPRAAIGQMSFTCSP